MAGPIILLSVAVVFAVLALVGTILEWRARTKKPKPLAPEEMTPFDAFADSFRGEMVPEQRELVAKAAVKLIEEHVARIVAAEVEKRLDEMGITASALEQRVNQRVAEAVNDAIFRLVNPP